jgi:sugar lactone lactonase YvrE
MTARAALQADLELDLRCALGEGPVWDDRAGDLVFVDILAGRVHRYDPARGSRRDYDVGAPVGAAVPREDAGLVLAVRDGFATLDPASGAVERLARIALGPGEQRMNDAKADPAGRFWAGTLCDDGVRGGAALYRLEADGTVVRALAGVTVSNGLAWSADGRTMYYVDTPTGGVDAFAFDAGSGTLGDRRRVVDVTRGVPDGMTVDADGCLWVALFGGGAVHRYTPDGDLDRVIELPVSLVTSCAFGGAGLDVLYITTASHRLTGPEPLAGALFSCRPGPRGLPSARYAG